MLNLLLQSEQTAPVRSNLLFVDSNNIYIVVYYGCYMGLVDPGGPCEMCVQSGGLFIWFLNTPPQMNNPLIPLLT